MSFLFYLRCFLYIVGRNSLVEGATDCIYGGSLLTYYINGEHGPSWPGYQPFNSTKERSLSSRIATHKYRSGDEVATYIETGGAYTRHGPRVGDLNIRDLFLVQTIVIDVKQKAAANSDYEVGVKDIEEWILNYGKIPQRAFVVFNTGWSFRRGGRYFGTKDENGLNVLQYVLNMDLNELPFLVPGMLSLSWPGLSERAAEYLVRLPIIGVGIDTPSIEAGWRYSPMAGGLPATHSLRRYLTAHGLYLVHNLLILDVVLPPRGLFTTLGVFRIRHATRAPVTVYTEFCVDSTPTLRCYFVHYRNTVFGIHPHHQRQDISLRS